MAAAAGGCFCLSAGDTAAGDESPLCSPETVEAGRLRPVRARGVSFGTAASSPSPTSRLPSDQPRGTSFGTLAESTASAQTASAEPVAHLRSATSKTSRATRRLRAATEAASEMSAAAELASDIAAGRIGWLARGGSAVRRLADPYAAYEKLVSSAKMFPLGQGVHLASMRISLYGSLYSRHRNAKFADDWRAAIRGAVFALILAVPLILPPGYVEEMPWLAWLNYLRQKEYYTQSTVVLFIFSFWRPLGPCIELVKEAYVGMCVWLLFQLCLIQAFPEGAYPGGQLDSLNFGMIAGVGTIFCALMLFLNFTPNTVMWTLTTFAPAWMTFLSPLPVATMEKSVASFVCALLAGVFCVLANMLPFPLTALGKAGDAADDLVSMLRLTWDDLIDNFFSEEANEVKSRVFAKELRELHALLDEQQQHIQNAWYESRFSGRSRAARRMMKRLHQHLLESHEELLAAQQACARQVCDDMPTESLRPRAADLVASAGQLLTLSSQACKDGQISQQQDELMQAAGQIVESHLEEMTAAFAAAKAEAGLPEISAEAIPEHVFCQVVSSFARSIVRLAEDLRASAVGNRRLLNVREARGLKAIFDCGIICDRRRLHRVVLYLVKVLISFWFGWLVVPGSKYKQPYDSGIAGMQLIVLVSMTTGSSMAKHMARLQGVVLGTILGTMAHVTFCWGNSSWYLSICCIYGVYIAFSLYIYFHSQAPANSYLGFLLAVFGTENMVSPCADQPLLEDVAESVLYKVQDIVVAIGICVALDALFAPRVAAEATQNVTGAWKACRKSLAQLFDEADDVETSYHSIASKAARAAAMGAEAAQEPRCSRAPWKEDLFGQTVGSIYKIGQNLSQIEYSMARATCRSNNSIGSTGNNPAVRRDKGALFKELLELDSLRCLGRMLQERMDFLQELLSIFRHDSAARMDLLDAPTLWEDNLADWKAAYEAFLLEADRLLVRLKLERVHDEWRTLEDDAAAKTSLLAACLSGIYWELRSVKQSILSA